MLQPQQILSTLKQIKHGRYIKITKSKDLGSGVTKVSDMLVRLGVSYSNMEINESRQTGSLPWGNWVAGLENLVIEHKGKYYLRITSTDPKHPESGADILSTTYFKNNTIITEEEAIQILGDKKLSASQSPVCNIKFENILSIGK